MLAAKIRKRLRYHTYTVYARASPYGHESSTMKCFRSDANGDILGDFLVWVHIVRLWILLNLAIANSTVKMITIFYPARTPKNGSELFFLQ